ncbi:MAG: hypothetical protein JWP54_690 [Cryobacterium sp.]|nr:hypothetical protein [Cryobacterium sp.]
MSVLDGQSREVAWGQPWQFMSAAYWIGVTEEWRSVNPVRERPHRLGTTFAEEVVACMLGGHGVTFEMNVGAFHSLRQAGLIDDANASTEELSAVLHQPLIIGERLISYRYPNQKASRIAEALGRLRNEPVPAEALDARDWLMTFRGIGPKTASWIVRNHYDTDDVAIIDIHIQRAGVQAGVFDPSWSPLRHYWTMERAFLEWARIGDVPAGDLDAVIWIKQAANARLRRGISG